MCNLDCANCNAVYDGCEGPDEGNYRSMAEYIDLLLRETDKEYADRISGAAWDQLMIEATEYYDSHPVARRLD